MNTLQTNQNDSGGFIYVIDFGDRVKIGCSKRPKTRVREVSSYLENYAGLKAGDFYVSKRHINFRENEKKLHTRFSSYQLGNSEMFTIPMTSVVSEINHHLFLNTDFESERKKDIEAAQMLVNTFKQASKITLTKQIEEIISDEERLENYIENLSSHVEQMQVIRDCIYSDLPKETLINKLKSVSSKYREEQQTND